MAYIGLRLTVSPPPDPPPEDLADLLPRLLVLGASSVTQDGTLHVAWSIKNQGAATADSTSTTAVRITSSSTDPTGSDAATAVTSALGPGASVPQNVDITVPHTPGTYYVWVIADSNLEVSNQSTRNNDTLRSTAITVVVESPPPVFSDLIPRTLALGADRVGVGGTLHVSWNIRNQGDGDADSTSTTAVRITSSAVSSAGSNAATVATPALAAGASVNQSADVTVPDSAGTYYVWVLSDSASEVSNQSNTANDSLRSAAFTVFVEVPALFSDLIPLTLALDAGSVEVGGTLHVSWIVKNQGDTAASAASTTAVRITSSSVSSAGSDAATVATAALGAGATAAQSADVTVPGIAGTYYVWVIADSASAVTNQSNTANDTLRSAAFTTFVVTPPVFSDLIPLALTLGASSVETNATLHVSWTMKNQGAADADSTSATAVRITSSAVSSAGANATTVATSALAAGATESQSADITAPSSTGTYYVWVIADNAGAVTNQSNTANDTLRSAAFTTFVVTPPPPLDATNTMTIVNKSGVAQTNYPLQFGRPFILGAIPRYPQVLIDGTAVATQADVKNRHTDASCKFAVIAVVIPLIPVLGTVTLTFQDQASGHNTALSKADMLDSAYNFDAHMALAFVGGVNGSASARTMLNDGHYKLWTSGGIAQTVEIADDTAGRAYDLGPGDGFHPFRPRFYATFWPALHKVFVRYVGENGLATELEDLKYALTLTIGNTSPTTVYAIDLTGGATNNKLHWFTTRWTKRFWLGGTPEPKININHNLAYLASTNWMPNFDTSQVIPETKIASQYAAWLGKTNDLYDGTWNAKGLWQSGMGTPGARAEIAPYPEWTVDWLYTGDWRMREFSLGQTDIVAAVPANLREGHTTKRLSRNDVAASGTGLGHAMSITDRKTICLARPDLYNFASTLVSDRATIVGPFTGQWSYNQAHEPAPFYPQYVLHGDPWCLDQMYMWAAFGSTQANGSAAANVSGRGPTGAEGVLNLQLRGQGWAIRSRAEVAWAAPDAAPEKEYFTYLITDACARWEGGLDIAGTALDGNAVKAWGTLRGNYFTSNGGPFALQPPTLHNWEANGNPTVANATVQHNESLGIYQVGKVGNFTSPWMLMYDLYGFGRVKELGFDAIDGVLGYTAKWFTDCILHTGVPKLLRVYQMPVEKKGGGFMSFSEILTQGLDPTYVSTQLPAEFAADLKPDGRTFWAAPGMAMIVDSGISEAVAAYAWYNTNVYAAVPSKNTNPKWAIVPRP